ncbi:hypothetical protein [Prosthecobacter sp.]|uniref:hypothetical protein n=1 Tax=Prosthecobacter sp. TaxID=1965333 RepID=UPI0037830422
MSCRSSPSHDNGTQAVAPDMCDNAKNGRRLSGLSLAWPLLFLPLAWSVGRLEAALLVLGALVLQAVLRRLMRARHSAKGARRAAGEG